MLPVECVVRGYITGSGWKDYQATGSVSGIALPAGLQESEQLPEPIFTPSTKAEIGHDEAIDFDQAAALVGDRALMERVRDVSIALYTRRVRARARERRDPRRHEVRVRPRRGRAGPRRRGADARLLALLARRGLRGRPRSAELRQAVRARLGVAERLGQVAARRPSIPDDVVAGTRARYVEAYERITGEPFQSLARSGGRLMRARVLIRPKAGILDPQGVAVEQALPALGFAGVQNVHVGRIVELDVEDPAQLDEMCRRLLANPLVEDYEVQILDGDGHAAP